MVLVRRRDGRNFGYGRQRSYAGPQGLNDMFGGDHYGTVKAHIDRWRAFVKWCPSERGPGINDARQIDRKVLADYPAYLRDAVGRGDLAVSTAQNRLSSVNRAMAALRDDQCIKLPSPSSALGIQRLEFASGGMSGATDEFTLAAAVQNLRRLGKLTPKRPPSMG